ncbi:hypothetical protein PsorP6_014484 [Peronosclerospora sorghi]|uniref:Uncharacterized protein n=1 Tax=Peronosclerospora sorghi TaxID=230839 RepID=A0ACC0VRE1_9STRA|nr:hypothetical protein PsorP6_014484 [Peronosclerospora sorghi]
MGRRHTLEELKKRGGLTLYITISNLQFVRRYEFFSLPGAIVEAADFYLMFFQEINCIFVKRVVLCGVVTK